MKLRPLIQSIILGTTFFAALATSAVEASLEKTLSIIKPDLVAKHQIGAVLKKIENRNLHVVNMKMVHLTPQQVEAFYAEHRGKPYFRRLVQYMISGPLVVQVLEGENAIQRYRELMGKTDPEVAAQDTLRAIFGENITKNGVHGSDSPESAKREIDFFFKPSEEKIN